MSETPITDKAHTNARVGHQTMSEKDWPFAAINEGWDFARRLERAANALEEALESCRLMVENEIAICELMGASPDAWPDLLDGRVSGGGIKEALAQYRKLKP